VLLVADFQAHLHDRTPTSLHLNLVHHNPLALRLILHHQLIHLRISPILNGRLTPKLLVYAH